MGAGRSQLARFPEFHLLSRSFCLRVSGAVAPSAPRPDAGSLPRGIMCWPGQRRLTADGPVAVHHKRGRGLSNQSAKPRTYSQSLTHILSGTCDAQKLQDRWSKPPAPGRKGPAGRPVSASSDFGQDVMRAIEAAEILRQREGVIAQDIGRALLFRRQSATSPSDRSCRPARAPPANGWRECPTRDPRRAPCAGSI